jgi:hypothetical protein
MCIKYQPIWEQGSKWVTYSLLEIHHENCPVSRQTSYIQFLQAAVAGPILGIDFLRKFSITVAPETSQIMFACTAAHPACHQTLFA